MEQQQSIPNRLRAITQKPLTEEAWEDFEDLIAEIDIKDNALLPQFLESFACVDDDVELLDYLWDMIHKIEAFEAEAYLRALVNETPFLREHAPECLHILWTRILNNAEDCTRLKRDIFPSHDIQIVRAYLLADPELAAKAGELF